MCAIASRTTPLPTAAADMTALPVRAGALSGLVCMYAVIHLDTASARLPTGSSPGCWLTAGMP